ncbi:hypothetical protein Sango_2000200 [Sesamum angolense]|uniref:Uncharacterized protein n=1 Tax=Sesamum angolense TaxID=2727404 RepID=A0AAE2BNU8_9LAMI|nr:hypothetical protein Sango_2000200 [Sesamum angolense]
MEACGANKTLACQNITNNCGSVADPSDSTNYSPGDLSMDDLFHFMLYQLDSELCPFLAHSPLKLVSAMKGSREKQGTAPKKLSVTWAPDVYDPTPTAASHVPSSKNQHYRNDGKKHWKNKQKKGGKSSRGSRGKDKKQARKNSGDSAKLKPLHDNDMIDSTEPLGSVVDFHGASPDPFCGSSFLKKSVATLHFPVTEAT